MLLKRFIAMLSAMVLMITGSTGVVFANDIDDGNVEIEAMSKANVNKDDTKVAVEGGYIYFNKEKGEITGADSVTKVVIPETIEGVTVISIGDYAFRDCINLESISLPNNLKTIGKEAFWDCFSIEYVTIPSGVTYVGSKAFGECIALKGIIFQGSVKSIEDYTFWKCSSLIEVTLSDDITNIGKYAFEDCSSLTEIILPNGITNIGDYAFGGCKSLTKVEMPNSVTSMGASVFSTCDSLKNVKLSENITGIGMNAFLGCALQDITIPASVKSIGSGAFEYCSNLSEVIVPREVTSIGSYAFQYCSSLSKVIVPKEVTSIGKNVFKKCSELTLYVEQDSYALKYAVNNSVKYKIIDSHLYQITDGDVSLEEGSDSVLIVASDGSTPLDVKWTISGDSVSVTDTKEEEENGSYRYYAYIKGLKGGNSVISAEANSDDRIEFNVEVSANNLRRISDKDNVLNVDDTTTLSAASKDSTRLDVSWSSSDSSVVSIETTGTALTTYYAKIKAVGVGDAVITAKAEKGGSVTYNVTVNDENLYAVTEQEVNIDVGEKIQLTAGSKADKAFSVNWKCDNYDVLQTNSLSSVTGEKNDYYYSGTFTGIKAGKAKVTIKAENGSSVEFTVSVGTLYPISNEGIKNIDDSHGKKSLYTIQAGSNTEEALDVRWSSSDENIVKIKNTHRVSSENKHIYKADIEALKHGKAEIYVQDDKGNKVTFTVEVDCIIPTYIEKYNNAVNDFEAVAIDQLNEAKSEVSEEDEKTREETLPLIREKMLSLTANSDETEAAVNVIYDFMCQKVEKKLEFENISIGDSTAENIVQEIYDCLENEIFKDQYGDYEVYIDTTGIGGAYMGSIIVKNTKTGEKKFGAITSSNTSEIMQEFVKQLQKLEKKAINQSIISAVDFFGDSLGINKYIKNSLKNKAKKAIGKIKLNNKVFDYLISFIEDTSAMYTQISKIDVTNINGTYKYVNKLASMDMLAPSDTISDYVANKAYNKVVLMRNNLIKAAIADVYGTESSEDESAVEKFFKKWGIMCPVDVVITDANGNELGSVIGNAVTCSSDVIDLDKTGDMKTIYLLKDEDININLTATGYGKLNVSVSDYTDEDNTSRSNFYDIPLSTNAEFSVNAPKNIGNGAYISGGDEVYTVDEYFEGDEDYNVDVTVTSENGSFSGVGTYLKGDAVSIVAMPDKGYKFSGWYDESGELLSYSVLYGFTIKEDTNLIAKFVVDEDADDSEDSDDNDVDTDDEKTYLYGDASADSNIMADDAALVLQKSLNYDFEIPLGKLTDKYLLYLDVDCDGLITAGDAALILQKSLDNDFELEVEKQNK